MSRAPALVLHQFRFEQKVFWRSPAAVFFTVMFPVIFLLLFASLFGNETIDELGIKASDLLRARDHHARRRLGDPRQRRDADRRDARERPAQAVPGDPAAHLGLRRRARSATPSWSRVLMVVLVTADREPPLRRADPDDDDPGAARHPGRRHVLVLLDRLGAQHRDPERGGGSADHQLHRPAALLPLRRVHPRDRDPRWRARPSPRSSRSGHSSRRS